MNLISTRQCEIHLFNYKCNINFKCSCGYNQPPLFLKKYSFGCRKCKKKYSVTNGTIFHNVRFGLLKAFRIVHKEYQNNFSSDISLIAKEYNLTYKTAKSFLMKIRTKKESVKKLMEFDVNKGRQDRKKIENEKKLLASLNNL